MSAKSPTWPEPKSEFLADLVSAFRKRSKAIKYKVTRLDFSIENDNDLERLNADFLIYDDAQVRLSAWDDGILWWRVCKGSKDGWVVNYSIDVESTSKNCRKIVAVFEYALADRLDRQRVVEIWATLSSDDE